MLKKITIQLLAVSMMLVMLNGDLFAQKAVRINFKRGASSASVSGSLPPNGKRRYVMRVKAEQEINAVVSGSGVSLDNGMLTMTYNAPNGDNFIEVINRTAKATKYTLTVAIQ